MQLPTLDKLHAEIDPNASPLAIAQHWFLAFAKALESHDATSVTNTFLNDSFWRDILALTWDLRTIHGLPNIRTLLDSRLRETQFSNFHLSEDSLRAPALATLGPGLTLVQFCFDFETKVGKGTGVGRLAPLPNGEWKAYTMFTCIDALKDFPEKIGLLRNTLSNRGTWEEHREREREFLDQDPTVVIVGGGHTGLETAAHLKNLGIRTLIVEKNKRIGDSWRDRYKSLCLHDPVWFNELPFIKYPPSWPVFCPAPKLADWLESWAHSLELDIWTSSYIQRQGAVWDNKAKIWNIEISRDNGTTRVLKVKHLVFATGFGAGIPNVPQIPGQEIFHGSTLHSAAFTSARNFIGKKVVVVGACNSAHDIAQDLCDHGVDVTMYQRAPTYIITEKTLSQRFSGLYFEGCLPDFADHISASLPFPVSVLLDEHDVSRVVPTSDNLILEGLRNAGFLTNTTDGILSLFLKRGGGYYIDTGTSQHIIDGHIKLKAGSAIECYTQSGLKFEDGSELAADVIVFATGFGDARDVMRTICAPDVSSKVGPLWGVDKEGELNGVWRPSGHDGLWFALGNFQLSRFHSNHLAIQIKAIEEDILKSSDRVM